MPLLSSHLLLTTHALSIATTAYILLTRPQLVALSTPVWLLGESMHVPSTSPSSSSSSSSSFSFSSSMRTSFNAPSEPLAALALVLVLSAITQLLFAGNLAAVSTTSATTGAGGSSKGDSTSRRRGVGVFAEQAAVLRSSQASWMTLAGLRVLAMAGLVLWIYLAHADRTMTETETETETRGWSARSSAGRGAAGEEEEVGKLSLLANRTVFAAAFGDMLFWGYMWTVLKEEGRQLAEKVMRVREDMREAADGWED